MHGLIIQPISNSAINVLTADGAVPLWGLGQPTHK
jgi:hypothetical protein